MEKTKANNSESVSSRHSIWFRADEKRTVSKRYSQMLLRDLTEGIMPMSRTFISSDGPFTKLLTEALPNPHRTNINLSEGVRHFVAAAADDIVRYGEANYEIIYKLNTQSNLESFQLEIIPPLSIFTTPIGYFQLVPKKYNNGNMKFIHIPSEYIIHISFPKELGGFRKLKKTIVKLDQLDDLESVMLHAGDIKKKSAQGFDFDEYIDSKEYQIAHLTAYLGWSGRQKWDKRCLEYYSVYNYLKFERVKAVLRKDILDALVNAVSRIVGHLNLYGAGELKIVDLITVEDVDIMLSELHTGKLDFESAVATIRKSYL